jgi:hypothetical protein
MAIVPLDFQPPEEPNIVSLHIYESAAQEGPFIQIEEVTDIGTYPSYITRYTTSLATNATNWFGIAWEDDVGAIGPMSNPVQGGTETLVNIIVNRVMLRDPSANEIIATQEAEAVISAALDVEDPYSVDPTTLTPVQIRGLTNLTLARSYMTQIVNTSSTVEYTAGLVSEKRSDAKNVNDAIAALLASAIKDLEGLPGAIIQISTIAQMTGCELSSGAVASQDFSRLLISIE